MTVELLPHQIKAVNELSNGKVLVGGVGVGKTPTALVYFFTKVMGGTVGDFESVKNPMDLYVFTTARKRNSLDWEDWAIQLGISTVREYSVAGIQLTVDSYNNITKYKDVKDAFIILDEQRLVGAGAWTKAFLVLAKSNRWIMLSATPGDIWEDYIPLFVANGFYKNRTQFKREHCIYSYYGRYPKLERYLNVGKLVRLKNSILVDMPYEKHTTRHINQIKVGYDKELFEKVVKKRWHVYENRPLKDVSELFSVMRKVVNSDCSRLATVQNLLLSHPRVIVFYNFDYELDLLRDLITDPIQTDLSSGTSTSTSPCTPETISGLSERRNRKSSERSRESTQTSQISDDPWAFTIWAKDYVPREGQKDPRDSISAIKAKYEFERKTKRLESKKKESPLSNSKLEIAEWNGHKHEPVPTSDRWVYLVQYVAGAEAWNCTSTDTVVFYSLTYSYKNFEQAQGRIDRLNTPYLDLNYYVLVSDSPIDRAVSKALKNKKSFNERDLMVNT